MNFHNVNLPKFIAVFAIGHPSFSTSCLSTISGREVRSIDREHALQKYTIKNCCLSLLQFQEFNSFFRARRGQHFAFRFRDQADYIVKKQFIAKGDNSKGEFPLIKLYEDEVEPYHRRITKPVKGEVKIYLNDNEIEANIDYDKGKVILDSPPGFNDILSADFIFDVAVRFGADSFEYNYKNDGAIELSNIELIEVSE